MSKHTRVLAAAVTVTAIAAAVAIPSLSGAHAGAASTSLLRIYDQPVTTTLTTTSGQVTSHPPYPRPKPGDVLDVYSLDYSGNHLHHAARWSMSNHLRCTFGHGAPTCESDLAVASSLLVFDGNNSWAAPGTTRARPAGSSATSRSPTPRTTPTSSSGSNAEQPYRLRRTVGSGAWGDRWRRRSPPSRRAETDPGVLVDTAIVASRTHE